MNSGQASSPRAAQPGRAIEFGSVLRSIRSRGRNIAYFVRGSLVAGQRASSRSGFISSRFTSRRACGFPRCLRKRRVPREGGRFGLPPPSARCYYAIL
jgi:hypothetical protein